VYRLLFVVSVLAALLALCGFQTPQGPDLAWVQGKYTGTELYKDDQGVQRKYNLQFEATRALGHFDQLDFHFTGDDAELNDDWRLMIYWDKNSNSARIYEVDTDFEDDDDPIYELEGEFTKIEKDSIQWGTEEQRLKLTKSADGLKFTIEDSADGQWQPNTTIMLKAEAVKAQ
jgi:hypothetical protein